MRNAPIHRQKGLTSVEFSIVAVAMFIVLFAAVEMGRALFVMNLLSEATRRAVRVAAVCPINDPAILQAATLADTPGGVPLDRLDSNRISVVYLNQNGNVVADPTGNFGQIRYVRVSVTGYVHDMIVPFLNLSIAAPDFAATLPRESLGIPREGAIVPC